MERGKDIGIIDHITFLFCCAFAVVGETFGYCDGDVLLIMRSQRFLTKVVCLYRYCQKQTPALYQRSGSDWPDPGQVCWKPVWTGGPDSNARANKT